MTKRPTLRSLFCLLLATVVFYWQILLTRQYSLLTEQEAVNQGYSWFHFWIAQLRRGAAPLWDPYTSAGHSFSGEMQTAAFYPLNLLLALFPFGSEPFVRHRERIWLELMGEALRAGTSLLFTFNPERTVSPGFPGALRSAAAAAGAAATFVELACPEAEVERRVASGSRRDFRKLSSVGEYRRLRAEGAFDYPALTADLRIEIAAVTPAEAARRIAAALGLPISAA